MQCESVSDRSTMQFRQKYDAVSIQSVWRAYTSRTKYNALQKSVLVVQSDAATAIQSVWRLFTARREYFFLQRYYIAVRSDATAIIQSVWRAFSARKEYAYRRKLVVMIQSSYRGHKSLQAYTELKASSITVQRYVKSYHSRSRSRSRVQYLCDSATAHHAFTTKSDLATVRIQAWWRMTSAVFSYRSVRVCMIVVQAVCRGFMARQYCNRLRLGSPLSDKSSNDSILQTERQDRSSEDPIRLERCCLLQRIRCSCEVCRWDPVIVPIPSSVQKTKSFICNGETSGQGLHPVSLTGPKYLLCRLSAPDIDNEF
jgi:hypothetical protein